MRRARARRSTSPCSTPRSRSWAVRRASGTTPARPPKAPATAVSGWSPPPNTMPDRRWLDRAGCQPPAADRGAVRGARAMPEMLEDPRFANHAARVENYADVKGWLTRDTADAGSGDARACADRSRRARREAARYRRNPVAPAHGGARAGAAGAAARDGRRWRCSGRGFAVEADAAPQRAGAGRRYRSGAGATGPDAQRDIAALARMPRAI